jgi:23S rRNA (guanosine2251-2'-O)-methyltransferase
MAGNSQRKGAMRNPGTKKGPTVGTGGARRKGLQPKGPTPKATERPHHPAARRERAAARRADEAAGKKINKRTGVAAAGRAAGPRKRPTADGGGFLMGRNSVVEALRAKIPAKALYVQVKTEADDRWREALKLATAFRIPIMEVTRTDLDRMTDTGVHQGLVLSVPAYEYTELDELKTATVLVALDGVTDPRNLGAIARSAAAFGAGGIVIPSRRRFRGPRPRPSGQRDLRLARRHRYGQQDRVTQRRRGHEYRLACCITCSPLTQRAVSAGSVRLNAWCSHPSAMTELDSPAPAMVSIG